MSKSKQLYNLRSEISIKSERIIFLMEHIIFKSDGERECGVLAGIALDEANRISRMSEKIGKILKH